MRKQLLYRFKPSVTQLTINNQPLRSFHSSLLRSRTNEIKTSSDTTVSTPISSSVINFFHLSARDINGNERGFEQFRNQVCVVINVDEELLVDIEHHRQAEIATQLLQLRDLYNNYVEDGFQVLCFPTAKSDLVEKQHKYHHITHANQEIHYPVETPDISTKSIKEFYSINPLQQIDVDSYRHKVRDVVQKFYDCRFVLFDRTHVNGEETHEVFRFLKEAAWEELKIKEEEMYRDFHHDDMHTHHDILEMNTKFVIDKHGRVVIRLSRNVEPLQMNGLIQKLLAER